MCTEGGRGCRGGCRGGFMKGGNPTPASPKASREPVPSVHLPGLLRPQRCDRSCDLPLSIWPVASLPYRPVERPGCPSPTLGKTPRAQALFPSRTCRQAPYAEAFNILPRKRKIEISCKVNFLLLFRASLNPENRSGT